MFTERTIIYFTPFYFKNGNLSKNKYFVVLKNTGNSCIVASLPSSKDYVPAHLETRHGCIECSASNFNCFLISPTVTVTQCGKKFQLPTYLYGHLLDDYSIENLQELYPKTTDYQIWGQMTLELFQELIQCFKNSKSVKRKYKKVL